MLFSSPVFICLFLPIVLILYYLVFKKSRKCQNVLLLIFSLFFYAWGEPKFVLVMVASIFINWFLGVLIHKHRAKPLLTKTLVAISVVINLSLLFVFKYLNFTINIFNNLFSLGFNIPKIVLPIGISFFTFQAMSYVFDVYRQKAGVQKDILCVGLYISFFPQLIAGPIVRYETVADEIHNRKETVDDFFNGFARFITGLAKKVLVANYFALLADAAFADAANRETLSICFSWMGAIAYTLQIFFDFSGYSDMAIGLGKMFGFHFLENFNYPYISTSVSEFWRRWHMSLGTWFRDYVYFPLGGSRVKAHRMIFNLFVVWFLTGLWHGANFTFIFWGLMYFALIAFEKLTNFDKKNNKYLIPFKWIYTMLFVVLGWVLFRANSISDAFYYVKSMFGFNGNAFIDGAFTDSFKQSAIMLALAAIFSTPLIKNIENRLSKNTAFDILKVIFLVALFVLSLANLVSSTYNPFIYFNF